MRDLISREMMARSQQSKQMSQKYGNMDPTIFTARRYASAVLAVIVCPSVRPSVTSRSCTKTVSYTHLTLPTILRV